MLLSLFFFLLQFVRYVLSHGLFLEEKSFCYLNYEYDNFETMRQQFENFFKEHNLKTTRKEFDTETVVNLLEKACQEIHPQVTKITNRMWFTLLSKMLVELDEVTKRVGCTHEVALMDSLERLIISNYVAFLGMVTSNLEKETIYMHLTSLHLYFFYYPEMRIKAKEFVNQYRNMEKYFYDLFLPQYAQMAQKVTLEYTLQKAFQKNEVLGGIYNRTLNCDIFFHNSNQIIMRRSREKLFCLFGSVIAFGLVMAWYFQAYTQSLYGL